MTSVRNSSSAASFWPPLTMPNSAACLIELVVSPPALARPMILALEACACSRKDEKSEVLSGCLTPPTHLAAVGVDDRGGVALQRRAEGVVGGQEEPGVAAGLDQRLPVPLGQHVGVVGPVHGVGRALRVGEIGGRRAGIDVDAVLFLDDVVDGERHAGVRHVDDDVDLVDIEPLPRDVGADIGLVLVIAGDDVDLPALGGQAGILDRHLRGQRRAGPAEIGIETGLVGQRADLDGLVLRKRETRRRRAPAPCRATAPKSVFFMLVFLCFDCSSRRSQTPR